MPEGIFALLAEALAEPADPAKLLALLKHRFAAFGMDPGECRKAARILELAVFRGRRGHMGIARLGEALAAAKAEVEAKGRHVPEARRRIGEYEWGIASRLAVQIQTILGAMAAELARAPEIEFALAARAPPRYARCRRQRLRRDGDRPLRRQRRRGPRGAARRHRRGLAAGDRPRRAAGTARDAHVRRLGRPAGRRRPPHPHLGRA